MILWISGKIYEFHKKFQFIVLVHLKSKNTLEPGNRVTSIELKKEKKKRQKNGDKCTNVVLRNPHPMSSNSE